MGFFITKAERRLYGMFGRTNRRINLEKPEEISEFLREQMKPSWHEELKLRFPFSSRIPWLKLLIFFAVFILPLLWFIWFTNPPRYSAKQTEIAEVGLAKHIVGSAGLLENNRKALEYLKIHHPGFYRKVVNATHHIRGGYDFGPPIINGKPWEGFSDMPTPMLAFFPHTILVNKIFDKPFSHELDIYNYSALLIHEADHLEWWSSSKFRQLLLTIRCNPISNYRISFMAKQMDSYHRFRPMEICAIREQNKFLYESGAADWHVIDGVKTRIEPYD